MHIPYRPHQKAKMIPRSLSFISLDRLASKKYLFVSHTVYLIPHCLSSCSLPTSLLPAHSLHLSTALFRSSLTSTKYIHTSFFSSLQNYGNEADQQACDSPSRDTSATFAMSASNTAFVLPVPSETSRALNLVLIIIEEASSSLLFSSIY